MKLSFSTLGCPGWDWEKILDQTKAMGFHGIEVRGILQELDSEKLEPFRDAAVPSTLAALNQYGAGCLSDQVFGQLLAHVAGLGYVLPEEHVKEALRSVFKNNFKMNFERFHNALRTYVLNDESGLLLCTWPKGGRPRLPFIYCDEVWTGIEYQVAAHLIYEGFLDEGLSLVKAVRERHDGYRRNPWNEAECGHHYARSMASWALLPALSGYKFDLVKGEISFKPVCHGDEFSCFFITGKAWGIYSQKKNSKTRSLEWNVETLYGSMEGVKVNQDFER